MHFNKKHGCPKCNKSKGELEIEKYLLNKKIKYFSNYKFDDCRNIYKLSFDFFLSKLNICIEYDGRQHYEVIDIFGGEEYLKKQIINDKIKTKYCIDNDIKLIRISYLENIKERLTNEIEVSL